MPDTQGHSWAGLNPRTCQNCGAVEGSKAVFEPCPRIPQWRADDRGDLLPIADRLENWAYSHATRGQGFGSHRWGRLDHTLLEAARGKRADDHAIEMLLEALEKVKRGEETQILKDALHEANRRISALQRRVSVKVLQEVDEELREPERMKKTGAD